MLHTLPILFLFIKLSYILKRKYRTNNHEEKRIEKDRAHTIFNFHSTNQPLSSNSCSSVRVLVRQRSIIVLPLVYIYIYIFFLSFLFYLYSFSNVSSLSLYYSSPFRVSPSNVGHALDNISVACPCLLALHFQPWGGGFPTLVKAKWCNGQTLGVSISKRSNALANIDIWRSYKNWKCDGIYTEVSKL